MKQVVDAGYDREIFQTLKNRYKGLVISPAKLRASVDLSNSESTYVFPMLEDGGQTVALKTEQRLNKNDVFFMTAIGFAIVEDLEAKPGIAVPQTYPNPFIFTQAADLEAVYNGILTYKVGTTEYITTLDLQRFRDVPETQQTAATNRNQNNGLAGVIPLASHYKIRGTDQVEFSAKLPVYNGIVLESVAVGTKTRMILTPIGFLIKNGASADKDLESKSK